MNRQVTVLTSDHAEFSFDIFIGPLIYKYIRVDKQIYLYFAAWEGVLDLKHVVLQETQQILTIKIARSKPSLKVLNGNMNIYQINTVCGGLGILEAVYYN